MTMRLIQIFICLGLTLGAQGCNITIVTECSNSYFTCASGGDDQQQCYCLDLYAVCLQRDESCFEEEKKKLEDICKLYNCNEEVYCQWNDVFSSDTDDTVVIVVLSVLGAVVCIVCLCLCSLYRNLIVDRCPGECGIPLICKCRIPFVCH